MRYLLDTHIILRLATNSPNLSDKAKNIILDEDNEKYVSVASCWEATVKISLKKLVIDGGIKEFYNIIRENNFGLLEIHEEHLKILESLPFLHRDPFDRLLVATAIADGLILLTDDIQIREYGKERLQIVS